MNSKSNSSVTVNLPWLGILTLVLIMLKLIGKITWGWAWVLSPLWVPFASVRVVALLIIALVFQGLYILIKKLVK